MQPSDLQPAHFAAYPPQAKKLAVANLAVLRSLPLSFLPSLLRELVEYDYKFPAERSDLDHQFKVLNALSSIQLQQWFEPFSKLSLSTKLQQLDWVASPALFVQQESAYLWSTQQLDAFRKAAADYVDQVGASAPAKDLPLSRLGIVVLGQGVSDWSQPLFRDLRPHGTYFENIKPDRGMKVLLAAIEARANACPAPYAHWFIDGARQDSSTTPLTRVAYENLDPVRTALLKHIERKVDLPGMGPEELRADMARLLPADLGVPGAGDAVLDRFQVKVLTEGSGTQLFSTSFVQWATREALRRAQPLTLMARFTPRQRQRPMNELLSTKSQEADLDPAGSLIDADMNAYYHWINQQRLPGSQRAAFLVWYENHNQALVISPSLPRNTKSKSALDLEQLLQLATT